MNEDTMKGGDFEREVAREISLWWSSGKRDDIFYRSHASGGRFTSRAKTGKDTAYQGGDITFSDPVGKPLMDRWNIECKTGYGGKKRIKDKKGNLVAKENIRWDVLDLIDSKQKQTTLMIMWEQCKRDALLTRREPILIFRRNGRSKCIMMMTPYYLHLYSWFGDCKAVGLQITILDKTTAVILSLSDFFHWIPDIRSSLELDTKLERLDKVLKRRKV
jgi:hypothetical protein